MSDDFWSITDEHGKPVPIQWDLRGDPFWLMGSCLVMIQSPIAAARKALSQAIELWPEPIDIVRADAKEIERVLKPTTYQARKRQLLKELAFDFIKRGPPTTPEEALTYRGASLLARDSFALFHLGLRRVDTKDATLLRWMEDHPSR